MSWSFYKTNADPKDVQKSADEYFGNPWLGTMEQPERSVVQLVHTKICMIAAAMPPGYVMNIAAYGSQSKGPEGAMNSMNMTVSFAQAPKEEPAPAEAPSDPVPSEPTSAEAPEAPTDAPAAEG